MFHFMEVEQKVLDGETEVQQLLTTGIGIDEVMSDPREEKMQYRSAVPFDLHDLKMLSQQGEDI